MKKVVKEEVKKEERKEFDLKESFALWEHVSKMGNKYLSGSTNPEVNESLKLVGYYNTNKKNPNEPDIRVYSLNAEGQNDKEVADLWENQSVEGKRYLSGKDEDNCKLVGFYNETTKENPNRPYIRVYFKENE